MVKKKTRGTSLRVPRQRRPSQLSQMQNLGGGFVVFFLEGQNRNFGKVRGLKLLLSLINIMGMLTCTLKTQVNVLKIKIMY